MMKLVDSEQRVQEVRKVGQTERRNKREKERFCLHFVTKTKHPFTVSLNRNTKSIITKRRLFFSLFQHQKNSDFNTKDIKV